MQLTKLIIPLLLANLLIACQSKSDMKKDSIETSNITFTSQVEEIAPPAPDFKSKFNNLHDWLGNICDGQKPIKAIATFSFGLFESDNEYTLYFIGINKYNKDGNNSITKIEFEPTNTYYNLSEKEYSDLKSEQIKQWLTQQLKEFITTAKFKQSFLRDATSIITTWDGTNLIIK